MRINADSSCLLVLFVHDDNVRLGLSWMDGICRRTFEPHIFPFTCFGLGLLLLSFHSLFPGFVNTGDRACRLYMNSPLRTLRALACVVLRMLYSS